jgi:hypothetical protein
VRYSLAIMAPRGAAGAPEGGERELLRVTADTPLFRGVQVGDEVLPRSWLSSREAREAPLPAVPLRVAGVRHVIAEAGHLIDHLTVIYTEELRPARSVSRRNSEQPSRN